MINFFDIIHHIARTMFDSLICALLKNLTTNPPQDKTQWYGPWNTALASLFPLYVVTPLHRTAEDNHRTRYLLFEVTKLTKLPGKIRTVLIVAVMHYSDWQAGIPSLKAEINRQAAIAFSGGISGPAISKVYWIGVLGPHWQYGVKDIEQPLIGWHDTIHDQASYDDFQHLAALLVDM